MNLPNQITLGRLVLAVAMFVLLAVAEVQERPPVWVLITGMLLFITIVATDALDGHLARKYEMVSDFGRIADPAVDKVVVSGTLIFLAASTWARPVLAPWIVVVIVGREFVISALRGYVESRGIDFGADRLGKLKMVMQCIAIPGVFFFRIVEKLLPDARLAVDGSRWLAIALVWIALALTVWSGAEYLLKARRVLGPGTGGSGGAGPAGGTAP